VEPVQVTTDPAEHRDGRIAEKIDAGEKTRAVLLIQRVGTDQLVEALPPCEGAEVRPLHPLRPVLAESLHRDVEICLPPPGVLRQVRVEGGAYGGMAMAPAGHPIFACASYRDPNIASTLSHFETGLSHVAAGLDKSTVDQSIIGSIGRLDAPRTPHEKGFGETVALLCGRTNENRQEMRDAILSATPEDLAQTAQHILDNRNNSTSVLGSASAFDKAEIEKVWEK